MGNPARVSAAFADVLRRHRRKQGLSQETLAERAGLHTVYISLMERRRRKPTPYVAALLAEALGEPLSKLVSEAEQATRVDERRDGREPDDRRDRPGGMDCTWLGGEREGV